VSGLHTELLKREVLRDFHHLWPDKFVNITNGVTPRRWVRLSNPAMAQMLTEAIGEEWIREPASLAKLEPLADDSAFRERWRETKHANKQRLVQIIAGKTGIHVDPESMFDIQVKRLHEYKRQHLNALHVIALYNRLRRDPSLDLPARTVIFGGKAAPGYFMAKLIIRLITGIAEVVNADPAVAGRLTVVYLPGFNVKNGERVYPAAELSEQISTAGREASGTGNMKFAMNGALTIGTLDGANVELRDAVGSENFFLFGLRVDEVAAVKARGYRPRTHYETNAALREALDQVASGTFSRGDPSLFRPLVDSLLERDDFLVLADFEAYVACQGAIAAAYRDRDRWTRMSRMSILNVARTGWFSSDRAIREYCERIWHTVPVRVGP
jgi:starch phosphorylase